MVAERAEANSKKASIDDVRTMLERLNDEGRSDDAVNVAVDLVAQLSDANRQLEVRLRQLLKQLYGRRSEKLSPNQLRLALEELAAGNDDEPAEPDKPADPDADPTSDAPPAKEARNKHPGRNPLPESLPRKERRHTVADEAKLCECCGKPKRHIRDERTEGLDWIPGHFEVIADIQEVWACSCGDGKVVTAAAPKRHVCGGLARCGLLAQVLINKFRDHLPLNRQVKIFSRAGVKLSPNTMGDWVRAAANALDPLCALIMARVMKAHVVQTDDTGILVLGNPVGGAKGKRRRKRKSHVKKGHIWTFVGDGLYVAYAYTPTWEKEGPGGLLAERQGWLQADGYGGFDHIFARGSPEIYEVGCMMHARRYWIKAFDAGDLRAAEPLDLIRQLYKIEADAKKAGDDADARLDRRQRQSAPLMKTLGAWILERKPNEPPKSPIGRALSYASNQWKALNRFLEDGALELDNGGAERSLRGTAIGRRNWLFAGSDDGARRIATINSVIESAVMHDLEPWHYLSDVMQKLDDGWPQSRLDELLPHRWAVLHQFPAGRPAETSGADGNA